MKKIALLIVVFIGVIGVSANAHHSFPATYHMDEEMVLRGKLVAFMYRNPHAFIHILVTDENGEETRWAVEWGSASFLGGQGITRTTLKPGDEVIVAGSPGRNIEDRRLRMLRLERLSDGLVWPAEGADSDFD